jgi:hypothetical protein
MAEKLKGLVLSERNVLRVDAGNSLVVDEAKALLIPSEDFAICERLAGESEAAEALNRLAHPTRPSAAFERRARPRQAVVRPAPEPADRTDGKWLKNE